MSEHREGTMKNCINLLLIYIGSLFFVSLQFGCDKNFALTTSGDAAQTSVLTNPTSAPEVATLLVTANPSIVPNGSQSTLNVSESNLTKVSYSCVSPDSGASIQTGNIDLQNPVAQIGVTMDMTCTFTGLNTAVAGFQPLSATVNLTVDCGNQIKDGGQCKDFSCQTVTTINSAEELMNIPARTADGICYAYRIMNSIANSPSYLTPTIDSSVISRNHDISDSDPTITHHPYAMGEFQGQFSLLGPRVVKLAGGLSASADILVDNFVLMGVYPTAVGAPADLTTAYQAMGTSDSSIANVNGVDTHAISFMNQLIPIIAFASGGTSSVAPVDITTLSPANIPQTLDVRALDCGGQRQLSDIYILFQ
jgi:hypothetical protein